jgi:hypothetical protein
MQVCFSVMSRGGSELYITALLLLCCSFSYITHFVFLHYSLLLKLLTHETDLPPKGP